MIVQALALLKSNASIVRRLVVSMVQGTMSTHQALLCAKVGNYAERVHHPKRLKNPMRRVGPKGVGVDSFEPVSWSEALDEVAAKFSDLASEYGSETIWPHYYAGTMGLVQRDGIERLRHAMRYSRQHSTICSAASDAGWKAGTGVKRGVDAREIGDHSDVVVLWEQMLSTLRSI